MTLFVLENDVAKPNVETLLIPPFKTIWENDFSESKESAIRDFTFIELMCSPRKTNPFFGYPESIRGQKIVEQVFKGFPEYQPSELVLEGMRAYLEFLTEASPSFTFLRAAKIATEKTKDFFTGFDYTERNARTGLPLYKPKEITSALTDSLNVMRTLQSLDEKVQQEIYETTKTKGMKEINPFEV